MVSFFISGSFYVDGDAAKNCVRMYVLLLVGDEMQPFERAAVPMMHNARRPYTTSIIPTIFIFFIRFYCSSVIFRWFFPAHPLFSYALTIVWHQKFDFLALDSVLFATVLNFIMHEKKNRKRDIIRFDFEYFLFWTACNLTAASKFWAIFCVCIPLLMPRSLGHSLWL